MKHTLLILLMILMVRGELIAQPMLPDSTLFVIESNYRQGQYIPAELEARRLFEQKGISDSVKTELHKWIAFSLIAQGKTVSAKERFMSILMMNNSFELDPILTSPKILTVFNEARISFHSKRKSETVDSTSAALPPPVFIESSPTYRTMLFPGLEQLHQGRSEYGYLFFGAGVLTLTSGIISEVYRSKFREDYLNAKLPGDIANNYDKYNSYMKAEIYSFGAFAAVYLLSQIDIFSQSGISLQSGISSNGNQRLTLRVKF